MKSQLVKCTTCDCRESSIFCNLSQEHLNQIDGNKTTNFYKPHQVVFYEGNNPFGLFCVNGGKVKVYKMDSGGRQQITRLAGHGDILGYRCLLAGEPYSATAETLEESKICFIDKTTFFSLLETHPAISFNVLKVLALELKHAENNLANFVHKSVKERLAELFLLFKTRFGEKLPDGGVRLNIALTREELAEFIGTTQETVIRLMTEFKNEALISVNGRSITLLDMARITEIASLVD